MAISLDLLYFFEMLFKSLARVRRIVPALRLVNDRHDSLVLYYDTNVDGVMHVTEDSALVRVANFNIFQKL